MIQRSVIILILILAGSFGLAAVGSHTVHAQSACDTKGQILTLKPWYYGLTEGDDCRLKTPGTPEEQRTFVATIVLNIAEDLIQLAGLIAFAFVIIGGFQFMTSAGEPDKASKARKTIISALIGAVAAGSAILLVNLVARTAFGVST